MVPYEKCAKCRFSCVFENKPLCNYFEVMGHTRTSLHPEGLTDDCREFQPRKRKRKPKAPRVK